VYILCCTCIKQLLCVHTNECVVNTQCMIHHQDCNYRNTYYRILYALVALKRGCKHDYRTKEASNCARLLTCCTGTSTTLISTLVVNSGGWRPSFQRQHMCTSGSSYACPTVMLSLYLKQASQMQSCSQPKMVVARSKSSLRYQMYSEAQSGGITLGNQIR